MKERDANLFTRVYSFVDVNFQSSLRYIIKLKNYLLFTVGFFLFLSIFGFIFPGFFQDQIFEMIKELILQTEGLSSMELIRFIFFNNLQSSFFAVLFGIIFGIVPFLVMVVNGYVIGVVANMAVLEEGIFVLWRLVPHGIFELPAVFISIALGLKLGFFWAHAKNRSRSFFAYFAALVFFIFSTTIFLVILAGISSIISPGILESDSFLSNISSSPMTSAFFIILFVLSIKIGIMFLSKKDKRDFSDVLASSMRVFVFIVVPLLVLAAIIEGLLIFVIT